MEGLSELLQAIRDGDVGQVRELIGAQPELASAGASGEESPVLSAVYRGVAEIIDMLVPLAALTLHEAAVLGDSERLETILMADPVAVTEVSHDGWTGLHLAAFFGQRTSADALLAAGADVLAISQNATANTPLHAALAGKTDEALVRVLLEAGADPNGRAELGVTPIHLAASRGDEMIVDVLVAAGARLVVTTHDGESPADLARDRGHASLAEKLDGTV